MRAAARFSFAVLAACAPLAACSHASMPPSYPQSTLAPAGAETKPLPDFQRRTLDGKSIDTKSLRGKVVVVKFFAKYCEPCKLTLPWVEKFAESHAGVAIVGIAEDERESDVRDVVAEYKLSFPVIHDSGNVLSGRFRVSDLPVTFVADTNGKIRWVGGPGQSEEQLEAAVSASSN